MALKSFRQTFGMDYHGILLDVSLRDPSIISQFRTLGTKRDGAWTISKVGVPEPALGWAIRLVQEQLKPSAYAHFYRGQELVVVFPLKLFMVTVEPETWVEAIAYGEHIGIPKEQLDFFPCRIQDELF